MLIISVFHSVPPRSAVKVERFGRVYRPKINLQLKKYRKHIPISPKSDIEHPNSEITPFLFRPKILISPLQKRGKEFGLSTGIKPRTKGGSTAN
jgi:hypothetical protein